MPPYPSVASDARSQSASRGNQPPASPPDEVDALVTAWQQARPELDLLPLQVWSRIARIGRRLERVRRRAFAEHGLETWEFDVLAALRRECPPYQLSPSTLAHHTMVTTGTMTNRVDRLEERGLVARSPSAVDRRSVLVALTTPGQERVDGALDALLISEQALLAGLDPKDATRLASQLRNLLRAIYPEGQRP